MTIKNVIDRIDSLKPNGYDKKDKIYWLSTLDQMIVSQVLARYISEDEIKSFDGYSENTPDDTRLLVAEPYSDMYLHWIQSRIEYYDGEIERYNNSLAQFESTYRDFAKHIVRTKTAKETSIKYW